MSLCAHGRMRESRALRPSPGGQRASFECVCVTWDTASGGVQWAAMVTQLSGSHPVHLQPLEGLVLVHRIVLSRNGSRCEARCRVGLPTIGKRHRVPATNQDCAVGALLQLGDPTEVLCRYGVGGVVVQLVDPHYLTFGGRRPMGRIPN